MTMDTFLQPVLALILWTLVMWLWMYATRIPAMQRAEIDAAKLVGTTGTSLRAELPDKVNWKADNYNHLHEQPTTFYALMLFAGATGGMDTTALMLGWAYVGARIVHSLVQVLSPVVVLRFVVFSLSTIILMVLAVKEALRVFL